MQRRQFYPGTYDATRWAARQSDVPGQQGNVGVPYDPSYQIDVGSGQAIGDASAWSQDPNNPANQASPATGQAAANAANANGYTAASFDSRPPLAIDFASPSNPNSVNLATDSSGAFVVPQGYIAIIRSVFFSCSGKSTQIDVYGLPIHPMLLSILVDGNPVLGYNNIDCSAGYPGGAEFECFIPVSSGSTIAGRIILDGLDKTQVGDHAGFIFYGNLLVDDGRALPQQQANGTCAAVCLDPNTIAAIKPPPMVLPPGGVVVQTQPKGPIGKINCPLPPAVSVNDYLACVNAQGAAINNPGM